MNEGQDDVRVPRAGRRRFEWLAAAAISVGLVGAVVSQMELGQLPQRLAAVHPGWLGAMALCSIAVLGLRSLRFWLLTPTTALPVVMGAVAVQNLLNKVTPLRLGELALPYYLARHGREPAGRALLLLVQVRLLELCMLAGAALLSALQVVPRERAPGLWPTAMGIGLLAISLAAFPRFAGWLPRAARRLTQATPLGRHPRWLRLLDKLESAARAGTALRPRQWLGLLLTTLGVLAANFALFACLWWAFRVPVPFFTVVLGASIGQAGALLPLTTVGSFGTLEGAWVAGFVALGVSKADAALTAIAAQLLPLAASAIFALPAYLYFARLEARRLTNRTSAVPG